MTRSRFLSTLVLTAAITAGLTIVTPHSTAAMRSQSGTPPSTGASQDAAVPRSSAFLRVAPAKGKLVVGEKTPVRIKAYFRAGVSASLSGLPLLGSDAFALGKLDDHPSQQRESVNGVPYTVVTWSTDLTALKPGDYPLQIELPIMLRVQEKSSRQGGGRNPFKRFFGEDSPFGDSFFDDEFFDNFFARAQEKELKLRSDGPTLAIEALPAQGRPAGFTGAVGQFDIAAEFSAHTAAAGDPLTLKLSITGTGNFDRVTTTGLPATAEWKTYKPSATASAAGAAGKTFTQAIIPLKPGAQTVPPVAFSYFDPEKREYVTKETAPIQVSIAPSTGPAAPVASTRAATAPAPNELASDDAVSSSATGTLVPLVLRPWFITANGVLLGALLTGVVVRTVRRRRASDPVLLRRAATEEAVAAALAEARVAERERDPLKFFSAARHALQERLAASWRVAPGNVTLQEIRTRLNGDGETLRTFFQAADQVAYSGAALGADDLRAWRTALEQQLQHFSRS
jgi:hypothetical protein